MKKLQINFTTPEQSKRLLELGVPADSADCCYVCYSDGTIINEDEPDIIPLDHYRKTWQNDIPCWSVGRLIEIYNITCERFPGMELQLGFIVTKLQTLTDYIIKKIEHAKEDSLAYFEALNVEE